MNDFNGKTVLILGASGQLGQAFRKAFRVANSKVLGIDIRLAPSDNTDWDEFDIVDSTSLDQLTQDFLVIGRKHDRLDVLVNNTGLAVFDPFMDRTKKARRCIRREHKGCILVYSGIR